jgi:hypothetical protein
VRGFGAEAKIGYRQRRKHTRAEELESTGAFLAALDARKAGVEFTNGKKPSPVKNPQASDWLG